MNVNKYYYNPPPPPPPPPIQLNTYVNTHARTLREFFSELAHLFFLIFLIKLMVQNTRKETEPDFSAILLLAQIWAKIAQNGPKIDSQHFFKIESFLFAGNRLRYWRLWFGCMVHHPYFWENSRLAKFWAMA